MLSRCVRGREHPSDVQNLSNAQVNKGRTHPKITMCESSGVCHVVAGSVRKPDKDIQVNKEYLRQINVIFLTNYLVLIVCFQSVFGTCFCVTVP